MSAPLCPRCKERPRQVFRSGRVDDYCRPCNLADQHATDRKIRHGGLTDEQYAVMLERQGGGCAICGGPARSRGGAFHVDHDHACCPYGKACERCIRGLLCYPCNSAVGLMRDDPALLRAAADYLEAPR